MNSKIEKLKDGESVEGLITIANYNLAGAPVRAHEIDAILQNATNLPHSVWKDLITELSVLCGVHQFSFKNRVVIGARSMQVARLIGITTYTGIINYGCLGTNAAAVTDSDTQLGTEVKRKQVASVSQTNDQVSIDFYYSKSDTNGTYQEFGMVVDGTSSANTGLLFNHALTGGWTKSSSESMTVSIQINQNAV